MAFGPIAARATNASRRVSRSLARISPANGATESAASGPIPARMGRIKRCSFSLFRLATSDGTASFPIRPNECPALKRTWASASSSAATSAGIALLAAGPMSPKALMACHRNEASVDFAALSSPSTAGAAAAPIPASASQALILAGKLVPASTS